MFEVFARNVGAAQTFQYVTECSGLFERSLRPPLFIKNYVKLDGPIRSIYITVQVKDKVQIIFV